MKRESIIQGRTSQTIRKYAGQLFGRPEIALDPATPRHNPTGARRFFTKEKDGLKQSWLGTDGLVFCNPPYGVFLHDWVPKIRAEADAGATIVALLPGQRFEQVYWQRNLFEPTVTRAIVAVKGRVEFMAGDSRKTTGNPYGSFLYLMGTGHSQMKALEVFRNVGMVFTLGTVAQYDPNLPIFEIAIGREGKLAP